MEFLNYYKTHIIVYFRMLDASYTEALAEVYWLLDAGYWMLRTPSACRRSFSGGTSFSVGVLDTGSRSFQALVKTLRSGE
ncbi:MAG: hypothetical protein K8R63_11270 [Bacteroidales bacterium]|nr:hypothetical protein [Bacteroidales bacterium]